ALYPAFMNLVRCDVVTRRLPAGGDFPEMWLKADSTGREAMLTGVATLLKNLVKAGAWHADLNLKNIYIAAHGPDIVPYVLDVDRVSFPGGKDIAARNFNRLARSARKWRTRWGLDFAEETLERLATLTLEMN
ncbi:MAG: lipopolysaccharide kinase, partial [Deltaproteobacteria bacterium]|nr:lipopolysaccharide kinase [Deltaproteobacteria bacterium]